MSIVLPTRRALMAALPPGLIGVEVGVYQGDFAAEILATPVARLHLVDCWRHLTGVTQDRNPMNPDDGGHETNYRRVLARFAAEQAGGRVVVHRCLSLEAAWQFEARSLDFVYLDADHEYGAVATELVEWGRKLKPGGFLMGHDYTDRPEALALGFGVRRAVDEFQQKTGWPMRYVTAEEWPSFCLQKPKL